jgi:hypothetical protein
MPDNYNVIRSERVSVTIAPDEIKDGQDSTIQAMPSGVIFHVVIVVNEATFADPARLERAVAAVAAPYADYFNQDVRVPGVVALSTYQDFDQLNNNVSVLEVTVASSENDDVRTTRTAPFTTAIPERFDAFVGGIRASLDELAAT